MDDEDTLREVEWRVATALAPDRTTAGRVLSTALEPDAFAQSPARHLETTVVVCLLAVLAGGLYMKRSTSVTPPAGQVTITGDGESIVVVRADGTRWLFTGDGASADRQGTYAIAVHPGGSK